MDAILQRIVKRAAAFLARRDGDDDLDEDERSLAQAHAAATTSRDAEKHAPDEQGELDGHVHLPTRRNARIDGFDLDAEVAVHAEDRDRLEHLARYILRPPRSRDAVSRDHMTAKRLITSRVVRSRAHHGANAARFASAHCGKLRAGRPSFSRTTASSTTSFPRRTCAAVAMIAWTTKAGSGAFLRNASSSTRTCCTGRPSASCAAGAGCRGARRATRARA